MPLEKPYNTLKGGIDVTKPKKVEVDTEKAKFWYGFGKNWGKRQVSATYNAIGLKSPAEVKTKIYEGVVDKWDSSKGALDRLTTHDSLYPILFRFFEQVYGSNSKVQHKETRMALARLVSQGFNVDYIPMGGKFRIENNKLYVKTKESTSWDHCNGLLIMLDEVDAVTPEPSSIGTGGGSVGGATVRTAPASIGTGGGSVGGATVRTAPASIGTGGGSVGGATVRTAPASIGTGGGSVGGATVRTAPASIGTGGGSVGGATVRTAPASIGTGGGSVGGATVRTAPAAPETEEEDQLEEQQ